jgi:outer membrane immunogenic protein
MKASLKLAIAAAVVFASPAFAADVPVQPVYKTPPVAYDPFAGWWLMGEAGYSDGSLKSNIQGLAKIKDIGFIGGVGVVGRTKGIGGFYWGLASSINYADQSGKIHPNANTTITGKENWLGRTTVQAGWAFTPNLLVYVDGGVAYGNSKISIATPGFAAKASDTSAGYTLGAGFDYALSSSAYTAPLAVLPGSTIGFEYAYIDFGKANYCFACNGGGVGVPVKNKDNLFMLNYKYRFGS